MSEHRALGALALEGEQQASIETCSGCRGYLKVFARLQPTAPEQVLLDDLGSLELDLAAQGRGYQRPSGPAYGA
jgi:FdhE protein